LCYSEALRKLGLRPDGGNHRQFRRYVDEVWRISTSHFDPLRARLAGLRRIRPVALEAVLVEGSSYSRSTLKGRLYAEGLKARCCELCGQNEEWRGARMSLILDHIHGIPDDNRLENLRIVCPNCAATFETHCGRKNKLEERMCVRCGRTFVPRRVKQDFCSRQCGTRYDRDRREPHPETRKVERPSYKQLTADVGSMSFAAIGRKYGVSDNAVRKWIRWYEYRAENEQARPGDVAGPDEMAA
jgi:Zn ribbon nucleic-acid-binding protein